MRIIKRADQETWDMGLTMHGSNPQRGMLKAGGQVMRWADVKRQTGTTRGHDGDQPRPRGSGERP